MANDFTDNKQHVLIFKTRAGDMVVGTDKLNEVSAQDWFREFLNLGRVNYGREPEYEAPRQAPPVRAPPVQQAYQQPQPQQVPPQVQPRRLPQSFLDVTPDMMEMRIWESLTPEQQQQWTAKYNPRS